MNDIGQGLALTEALEGSLQGHHQVHNYQLKVDSKVFNNAAASMISELALIDTCGSRVIERDIRLFNSILNAMNISDSKYFDNSATITTSVIEKKTWQWRKEIDSHITNLSRLRNASTVLLLIHVIIKAYYTPIKSADENTLWFAARGNTISKKESKWLLKADAEFNEDGMPTERGACKYTAKFIFAPCIKETVKALTLQWNRLYGSCEMYKLGIIDHKKTFYHKIKQLKSCRSTLVEIASNILRGYHQIVTNNPNRQFMQDVFDE